MNYKDCCRTCLSSNKEMRHINTVISIAGDHVRLSDVLQHFYKYKVSTEDQLPENICINCVYQLTITYSFKVLIERSAKTLALHSLDTLSHNFNDVDSESEEDSEVNLKKSCQVKEYNKRTIIQRAQRNTEIKKRILFCVECKAKFHSVKVLKEHSTNNHIVKSTVGRACDYCNEKFADFRSLVLHRKLHFKPYLCENCWEGFYHVNDLNSHSCQPSKAKNRNKPEQVLKQCDQCGKSYPSGYIRIHMLIHSNDRRYSCKYCPKKFKVPCGLNSHILWNHKRTRNHKCEVCNATFISSSSRSAHIRNHHLKEKKHGCETCGKRFFSRSELLRHSLTHTGIKNFHCHLCDKSFQRRYGLNVHLKSHSQLSTDNVDS